MFNDFNYKICLLDTNIVSAIIKKEANIPVNVLSYINDGYCVAIPLASLCELNDAPDIINELSAIFFNLKFILFKGHDLIRRSEITRYPSELSFEDCVFCELIGLSSSELLEVFTSPKNKYASSELKRNQDLICKQLSVYLKSILSQGHSESRNEFIIRYFTDHMFQYSELMKLSDTYANDALNGIRDPKLFILKKIKSMYMQADFVYTKHIKATQKIKHSDPIDILNISCLPYVDLFITENNNAQILKQMIKKNNLISHLKIKTIRELR